MAKADGESQPNEPLLRLKRTLRTLQREADSLLAQRRSERRRSSPFLGGSGGRRITKQIRDLRGEIGARVQRAGRGVEGRAERALGNVERKLSERLQALLRRLEVPTGDEIRGLSRRLASLEQRMKRRRQVSEDKLAPARPSSEDLGSRRGRRRR